MNRRTDTGSAGLHDATRRHRRLLIGAAVVVAGACVSTALAVPALADLANSARVHRPPRSTTSEAGVAPVVASAGPLVVAADGTPRHPLTHQVV